MTNPKDLGGLGLRRLKVMNKACIFKLGRKLQSGSQELSCNVLWEKYKREGSDMDVIPKILTLTCGSQF